jgi:uncharacterized membrane protein YeaQ/YmgE (transglycosylase-associated protein family)
MHILWTIIVGLVVGAIAKLLMPGKDPGGFIVTILLGIAGAFVGTWVGRIFAGENYTAGWIMSVIGAVILLLLQAQHIVLSSVTIRAGGLIA